MTRKDYEAAAAIVRNAYKQESEEVAFKMECAFGLLFENDNPRFNPTTFAKACQPNTTYKNRSR